MDLILDGLKLMVVGMLTVYIFLMIMVFCMNLMAKILAPIAAKMEKEQQAKAAPSPSAAHEDAVRAAVAAAAFHANSK